MKQSSFPHLVTTANCAASFDVTDAPLLQQAVQKLVRYGQQVGVSAEMIALLDSGINRDLLAFLVAKSSGAIEESRNAPPINVLARS